MLHINKQNGLSVTIEGEACDYVKSSIERVSDKLETWTVCLVIPCVVILALLLCRIPFYPRNLFYPTSFSWVLCVTMLLLAIINYLYYYCLKNVLTTLSYNGLVQYTDYVSESTLEGVSDLLNCVLSEDCCELVRTKDKAYWLVNTDSEECFRVKQIGVSKDLSCDILITPRGCIVKKYKSKGEKNL